jgi:uncharacterized protein YcfJ
MNKITTTLPILGLLVLAGCVSVPNGPSKMALPGSGKSFQQFSADDASCRQFALNQIGGKTAQQQANDSFVETAVVGTALGALVGAASGGHQGAGVGAATGLAAGSMVGSGASRESAYTIQQRYDNAYVQCMYANGEKVPVQAGSFMQNHQAAPVQAPVQAPPNGLPPPPPPGYGN